VEQYSHYDFLMPGVLLMTGGRFSFVFSNISTPTAVASSAVRLELVAWRAVEAQHQVSTLALVDSLDEQARLEQLLEDSKPAVPADARELHWLLVTPFRYPPLHHGSRFRAVTDPGVFYGSEEVRTACAELGYWRWRFLLDSPRLISIDPKPQTVFSAAVGVLAIDLRSAAFNSESQTWTNPHDYSGCQAMASVARSAGVGVIRYESVRDPQRGGCIAVLMPGAFAKRAPLQLQSWQLTVTRARVFWHRDSALNSEAYEFVAEDRSSG
jgi:hypothetical protein